MPKLVTITEEFLERGRSAQGGWTRGQLRLLGVAWPPVIGWQILLCGKKIAAEKAAQFLNLGKT